MNIVNRFLLKVLNKVKSKHQSLIYDGYRERYTIHKTFRFNGKDIIFYGNGKGQIIIGENTYIGEFSTIQADNSVVRIGKGCKISHNVRMYTSTSIADQDFSKADLEAKYGDIIIEDYVWIGANVFICPGVTIGTNSIVGANSVVSKNVEPFTIVGGVPAKLIRKKAH